MLGMSQYAQRAMQAARIQNCVHGKRLVTAKKNPTTINTINIIDAIFKSLSAFI